MNAELLCGRCGEDSIRRFARYSCPGEYVVHARGTLKLARPPFDPSVDGVPIPWQGPCVCDACNAGLPKGSPAVARTMGRTGDYQPWESTYLDDPKAVRP